VLTVRIGGSHVQRTQIVEVVVVMAQPHPRTVSLPGGKLPHKVSCCLVAFRVFTISERFTL